MLAGKSLQQMAPEHRLDRYYIGGCEADVWLFSEPLDGSKAMSFSAYSPSKIVRGLLAILLERANSLPINDQNSFDYQSYLADIGLLRFLSDSRRSGITAVIEKINQG